MTGPVFNLDFSLTTENPAVAEAHGKAIAQFMAMLAGQGSAADNHKRATSRAPRAVADVPEGDTDKALRAWVKAYETRTKQPLLDEESNPVPMRGRLPKVWRDWIIEQRAAEARAETDDPEDMLDAEVVETEETPEPATKGPRKWTRTGKTGAPKA